MATLKTTTARFVKAYASIGASSHTFGEAVRLALTVDKRAPAEVAQIAATAAIDYFDSVVRPVVESLNHADNLPATFAGIPQYKVAIDAIAYGSRLLARTIGYKIDGNQSRVKLADYLQGEKKVFKAAKMEPKQAPKQTTAKAKSKAHAIPAAPQLGPDVRADIIREHEKEADVVSLFELALKKAKRKEADMVALVDAVKRHLGMDYVKAPGLAPVEIAADMKQARKEASKKAANQ